MSTFDKKDSVGNSSYELFTKELVELETSIRIPSLLNFDRNNLESVRLLDESVWPDGTHIFAFEDISGNPFSELEPGFSELDKERFFTIKEAIIYFLTAQYVNAGLYDKVVLAKSRKSFINKELKAFFQKGDIHVLIINEKSQIEGYVSLQAPISRKRIKFGNYKKRELTFVEIIYGKNVYEDFSDLLDADIESVRLVRRYVTRVSVKSTDSLHYNIIAITLLISLLNISNHFPEIKYLIGDTKPNILLNIANRLVDSLEFAYLVNKHPKEKNIPDIFKKGIAKSRFTLL